MRNPAHTPDLILPLRPPFNTMQICPVVVQSHHQPNCTFLIPGNDESNFKQLKRMMLTAIHTIYPSIHNAAPAKCSIILSFLEVEKKKNDCHKGQPLLSEKNVYNRHLISNKNAPSAQVTLVIILNTEKPLWLHRTQNPN